MTTYELTALIQQLPKPCAVLTAEDYDVHMLPYAGETDWSTTGLIHRPTMVCQYTGYTRNQMLAAMLNAQLRLFEYAL